MVFGVSGDRSAIVQSVSVTEFVFVNDSVHHHSTVDDPAMESQNKLKVAQSRLFQVSPVLLPFC